VSDEQVLNLFFATFVLSFLIAFASHACLVVLSFRIGMRRGITAAALPPVAWIAAFDPDLRGRKRLWAKVWLASFVLAGTVFGVEATLVAGTIHQLRVMWAVAGGSHR
jgi:hypothetical protein